MSEQNDKLLNKPNLYVEVSKERQKNTEKENYELKEISKLVPTNGE